MRDVIGGLAAKREPDNQETCVPEQRQAERGSYPMRPRARAFMSPGFDNSGSEINANRKCGRRDEDGYASGSTSTCNPQPEERDVPSHKRGEDFAQRDKTDRIDRARGKCQCVKQQIANTDVVRRWWR